MAEHKKTLGQEINYPDSPKWDWQDWLSKHMGLGGVDAPAQNQPTPTPSPDGGPIDPEKWKQFQNGFNGNN